MKKLSKKIEKEIRSLVEQGKNTGVEDVLLAEIDRLREEIKLLEHDSLKTMRYNYANN